jgi:FtsH-binding integral membrane protein
MRHDIAAALAGLAIVLFAGALRLRWASLLSWSLAAAGGAYAVWLSGDHGVRVALLAPLLGGGLLVCGEVGYAIANRGPREPHFLTWLAAIAAAGVIVSSIVLLVATIGVGRSAAMTFAGTAAAVVAVSLLSRLARGTGSRATGERQLPPRATGER